jgi:hypothetical protein
MRVLLGTGVLWLAACSSDSEVGSTAAVDGAAPNSGGSGGAARGAGGSGAAGFVANGGGGSGGRSSGTGGATGGGTANSGGQGGRDAGTIDGEPPDSRSDAVAIRDGALDGTNVCEGGAPLSLGQGKKRLFETSARFKGDLVAAAIAGGGSVATGLAAGDELCNQAAAAAGLGGIWIAWLSDGTTDAIDRIQDVGPWYRLDGAEVFASKAALTGNPLVELWVTEKCTISDLAVWTGTLSNGTKAANTCNDWRSSASDQHGLCGFANTTTQDKWSEGTTPLCDHAYNLYCFER